MSYHKLYKVLLSGGLLGIIRIILYPVTLFLWGPIRLSLTLWNARTLAVGKWSNYLSFNVLCSINQLFYRTQLINIDRHGRNGVSPTVSLGNYNLGYWWHLSLPASYIYSALGAVLPLLGLFGWITMHLVYTLDDSISSIWLLSVLTLALISSTFYAHCFVVQNYNVLGWMVFPLCLWATVSEMHLISMVVWLVASFGSITVVFVGALFSLMYSLYTLDITILYGILPAILKVVGHLHWSSSKSFDGQNPPGIYKSIARVVKSIGITKRGAKYPRSNQHKISVSNVYFFLIYAQFGLIMSFTAFNIFIIWSIGFMIFLVNSFIARFADNESIVLMMFSFATLIVTAEPNPLILVSYWLVVSPLPVLLNDRVPTGQVDMLPPLKPYSLEVIIGEVERFLSPVSKRNKVLFCFNDPRNRYEDVFDGYRSLLEVPLYIASKNEFLLFPSWWSVFENNYHGASDFWGRDLSEIKINISKYSVDYIIVYTESGEALDKSFQDEGYKVVSELDWGMLDKALRNEKPWSNKMSPKWWLLSVK